MNDQGFFTGKSLFELFSRLLDATGALQPDPIPWEQQTDKTKDFWIDLAERENEL